MLCLGFFGKTSKAAVTSTADAFVNDGPAQTFVVRSDRNIHIARASSGSAEATVDDCPLAANEPAHINIEVGGSLSFILADGETDGSIYITEAN